MSNIRIVVLVISKPGACARWDTEKKVWLNIARQCPPGIKVYLIEGEDSVGGESVIVCPCKDSFIPGIYNKTVYGIKKVLSMHEHTEYIVRTNLSSFIIWSRLIQYIAALKPYYSGVRVNKGQWINGWGIILHKNLAALISSKEVIDKFRCQFDQLPDDVKIGRVLNALGFPCIEQEKQFNDYPVTGYIWRYNASDSRNSQILMQTPSYIFVRLHAGGVHRDRYVSALQTIVRLQGRFPPWRSIVNLNTYFILQSKHEKQYECLCENNKLS